MPEQDEVFEHVGTDRRQFLTRLVVGSAFAVPAVSSFSMSGVNTVFAQSADVSGSTAPGGEVDSADDSATTTSSSSTTSTTVGNGGNQTLP